MPLSYMPSAATSRRSRPVMPRCWRWRTSRGLRSGWPRAPCTRDGYAPSRSRPRGGLDQIQQGLAAYGAVGTVVGQTYLFARLADAYGHAGQTAAGLTVLAEALAWVDQHEERIHEAELHRLMGELLLQQAVPDVPQAETCLHQALAIARQQQAKAVELRTAISLSRLWQQHGKRDAARALLVDVYGWFTEGFDTADLQEAKALLEELGG